LLVDLVAIFARDRVVCSSSWALLRVNTAWSHRSTSTAACRQDPEFRKKFEAQAAKVKLERESHENIELKVVPRAAIEAEAAKIR